MSKNHAQGFLELVDDARTRIKETDVPGVVKKLEAGEKFYLVDTREDSEWEAGHAKGAIHIGKGVIERDIESIIPDHDAQIILYCGGGFRSVLAAEALQKMGYTNVISMDGGMRAWVQAGLPTE